MPPAIVAALIGAAVTGTTTGLEASGTIGGGSSGPDPKILAQQQAEAAQKQQQQQQQELFKHFAPDAQAATGGALSDTSLSSMIAELSGSGSDVGAAQQTIFGTTPGLSSGTVG